MVGKRRELFRVSSIPCRLLREHSRRELNAAPPTKRPALRDLEGEQKARVGLQRLGDAVEHERLEQLRRVVVVSLPNGEEVSASGVGRLCGTCVGLSG